MMKIDTTDILIDGLSGLKILQYLPRKAQGHVKNESYFSLVQSNKNLWGGKTLFGNFKNI